MGFGLNKDVVKRIVDTLGLQTTVDELPTKIIPTIQPVLISNPERIVNVVKDGGNAVTGAVTVFTTPTDRDFFLTSIFIIGHCDVTCDGTAYTLDVTLESGEEVNLIRMNKLTLTAFENSVGMNYTNPIKLKPGTDIMITGAFAAGNSKKSGSITGYTVDIV
jgi:hypothetical protein